MDYMKIKPKTYQMYNYDAIINQKAPKPKALHISLEPGVNNTTKVVVKDSFLDAIQNIIPEKLKPASTTLNMKRPTLPTKRPRPQAKPGIPLVIKQVDDASFPELDQNQQVVIKSSTASPTTTTQLRPQNNNLAGQSQIGNRESQMVIKPTVIVNIRGTVSNSEREIKLESRSNDDVLNVTTSSPQTVFNINQEVNIDRTYTILDDEEQSSISLKRKKPIRQYEVVTDNDDDNNRNKAGKSMTLNGANVNYVRERVYVFEIGPLGGFKNV